MNRLFKWLAILSTLIALPVFLFSIVSPFCSWSLVGLGAEGATYWSYRANQWAWDGGFIGFNGSGTFSSQSWFFNYWFNASNQYDYWHLYNLGISRISISLFVMQSLTLAFGCASLAIDRRIIRCLPICTSSTVLGIMSYVGYKLSSFNNFGEEYQLGYYLVARSIALFALAFALNEVRVRYLQSKESKMTSLSS